MMASRAVGIVSSEVFPPGIFPNEELFSFKDTMKACFGYRHTLL